LNGAGGTFSINGINPLTSFQTQITNNGYPLRITVKNNLLNAATLLEFEPPTAVGAHLYKIPARTDSPTTSYFALSVNEKYADSEGKVVLTEGDIIGTADEDTITGAVNVSLTAASFYFLQLTGNTTITFTDTPAIGESRVINMIVDSSSNTETLGFAVSSREYGTYDV